MSIEQLQFMIKDLQLELDRANRYIDFLEKRYYELSFNDEVSPRSDSTRSPVPDDLLEREQASDCEDSRG